MGRHNLPNKSIDIEARDINYILGAYIRSYLFLSKNQSPEKIIFPMYSVVPHPLDPNILIPIEYIPSTDQYVTDLTKDGSNIPEVTPAEEKALDTLDEKIEKARAHPKMLATEDQTTGNTDPDHTHEISPARAAMAKLEQPVRVPKMPASGDIGPGTSPDNMGSRDIKLERQIRKDLTDEPDIDESKEIPEDISKLKE